MSSSGTSAAYGRAGATVTERATQGQGQSAEGPGLLQHGSLTTALIIIIIYVAGF